jgi:hypothetical protein
MEGKAMQRKKKNEDVDKTWTKETSNKPLTMKNSGWGKNSH